MADAASKPNLSATDVLSVRSRVSWSAIAAGAMIALAVYFLLTLLGVAIGLEVAVRREVSLGAGAAIYSIVALLLAMFLGGWAASRLAVGESKLEAVLYGVILWGVLFAGLFWMVGAGVRIGFGAMMGLASGAVTVATDQGPQLAERGLVPTLMQRYDAELGGERFVGDLTKMGVEEERAREIQKTINERLEQVRTGQASLLDQARDAANDPGNQAAMQDLASTTRQATWYTLIGVIVSMVTVVLGSLAGSGDLPIPVPVLYVRRTPVGGA